MEGHTVFIFLSLGSLAYIFSSSIHFPFIESSINSFLSTSARHPIMCTHAFIIYPPTDGHLGWLCFLAIVKRGSVNMCASLSVGCRAHICLEVMWVGHRVSQVSVLRGHHAAVHRGCLSLCSHQRRMKPPPPPHPLQNLSSFVSWRLIS